MPLHLNETQDQITALTSFSISPVFEMLGSLQTFTHPWKARKWTEDVTAIMGEGFSNRVTDLYVSHNLGCDFIEFAIDYPDQGDIPGFINYIREIPVNRFLFYYMGRIIPLEKIPDNGNKNQVQSLVTSYTENKNPGDSCIEARSLDDVSLIRRQLTNLWEDYWSGYFKKESAGMNTIWEESLNEQENYITRNGGTPLYKKITGHEKLPPQLPENFPYSSIRYIPIYRISRTHQLLYGYGNITILYDAGLTDKKTKELHELKSSLLTALKALGDENRLKILSLIADSYQGFNGKKIAHKLGLSQSVVSRHLGQLKDAGLIKEFSPDNRNITYSIEWDIIGSISSGLQNYLEAGLDQTAE